MPELIYDVKFRIDPASAQRVAGAASGTGAGGTASAGQGAEKAAQEVKQLEISLDRAAEAAEDLGAKSQRGLSKTEKAARGAGNALDGTTDGMNRFTDLNNKLGTAAARTSKNFSSANQVLFSFSDGINDAAQFSQGFGVGMRAVGNNIGFTIELFASLNNRVREYNAVVEAFNKRNKAQIAAGEIAARRAMTTFGALRAAFAGPGGLLLAVNAIITAMTVLGTRTKKTESEIKGLAEITGELRSAIGFDDTGIPDPFGIRALSFHIGLMEGELSKFKITTEEIAKASGDTALAISSMAGGAGAAAGTISWLTSRFEKTQELAIKLADIMGGVGDEFNATNEAIKELNTELEKQRITQQAYTNFLNQEGNEVLKEYVELTGQLSAAVGVEQANQFLVARDSLVALQDEELNSFFLREQLGQLIDDQSEKTANLVRTKGLLSAETQREVALLNQMIKLYEELGVEVEETDDKLAKFQVEFSKYSQAIQGLLSAVSSLSSARTAENEKEARKQFETQKKLAYASAVVAGAEAVVKALPNPILAGIAAATTGVQLAAISRQQFDYDGKVEANAAGFQMNRVEGAQTFQTPGFVPTSGTGQMAPKVNVEILADRKKLYYMVKQGEEEYRQLQA